MKKYCERDGGMKDKDECIRNGGHKCGWYPICHGRHEL